MSEVIYGLVAGGFVLALWDAARRYFEVKVFNDRELARIIALEHEQRQQAETLSNLNAKVNVAQTMQQRDQRVRGLR